MSQVIIVGGGLAGVTAAHTVLQAGGNVCLIDKNAFLGGNSTKATSGINAAGTSVQRQVGNPDSPEQFFQDTVKSGGPTSRKDMMKVLTYESGPGVEWLMEKFGLDLSLLGLLGAHTHPRTHRGKERFPGMMITYALMEHLEEICDNTDTARVITKATVNKLIQDADGSVIGCEYLASDGSTKKEMGPVIICSGGFGADFSDTSYLQTVEEDWRNLEIWKTLGLNNSMPPLRSLPTTNGDHCTGDGIKMSVAIGANTVDMEAVQVHPTGLIDLNEPDAKVKFLAAEALRGAGGLLLDNEGKRFANDLGKRDYVSGRMWSHNKGPYRLVLNSAAAATIDWHCRHYEGRGLMRHMTGAELAKDIGISSAALKDSLEEYKTICKTKKDPFGKVLFPNPPVADVIGDKYYVAFVTPVVHYCMGGVEGTPDAEIVGKNGVIKGLFAAGEVMGGVHGKNRLGGSSLLDCVSFGRVAGRSATKYLLEKSLKAASSGTGALGRINNIGNHLGITINAGGSTISINVTPNDGAATTAPAAPKAKSGIGAVPNDLYSETGANVSAETAAAAAGTPAAAASGKETPMTLDEIAKLNTDKNCHVILHGKVYNVTDFLGDHPGGKKAIMLYAGKDASEEFDMLHKPSIITKYAEQYQVGVVKK